MAKQKQKQKDLLSRFADAGEEAFQFISSAPGADRVLGSALGVMHNMRDQIEMLSKRVRGIEDLEQRVAKLERELAKLSRASKATTSRASAPRTAASSKSSSRSTKKT
jgi:gamma-glutamyl phosphate reductase